MFFFFFGAGSNGKLDHYYIVHPSLSLHEMKIEELLQRVRQALSSIKQQRSSRLACVFARMSSRTSSETKSSNPPPLNPSLVNLHRPVKTVSSRSSVEKTSNPSVPKSLQRPRSMPSPPRRIPK